MRKETCPKCGSDMSLWCDKDIKERNFNEVQKLRKQIEAKDELLERQSVMMGVLECRLSAEAIGAM